MCRVISHGNASKNGPPMYSPSFRRHPFEGMSALSESDCRCDSTPFTSWQCGEEIKGAVAVQGKAAGIPQSLGTGKRMKDQEYEETTDKS